MAQARPTACGTCDPTALVEAPKENNEVFHRFAAPDLRRGFTEGGDHPVRGPQRGHGAQLGGLLAGDRGKRADPPLALKAEHALVEAPAEQHGAMELEQFRGIDAGLQGGVESAVFVQDGKVFYLTGKRDRGARHGVDSPFRGQAGLWIRFGQCHG